MRDLNESHIPGPALAANAHDENYGATTPFIQNATYEELVGAYRSVLKNDLWSIATRYLSMYRNAIVQKEKELGIDPSKSKVFEIENTVQATRQRNGDMLSLDIRTWTWVKDSVGGLINKILH